MYKQYSIDYCFKNNEKNLNQNQEKHSNKC